jgi:hypothetical protein
VQSIRYRLKGMKRLLCLNIETEDPPTGWGVRRTISNPPPAETAEIFEKNKTMFFTSIFCGSLFCGSAVYIFNNLADS